ncbi:LysR family transcriptional regulator [Lichenihabitans sp. Uapishka_5]|uniref:LysR family transcriptional regulator n=1 Tax=Lichenihabitans sp. Uapishka_5 TaxID=3037302 RepID=UPI0029E7E414|nr:LysR family transcriptional regulator [Lichenihabitans sp. Uapishka_5]MDX7953892.1 LysR family transcriptional regulator [Lichenihabitans sp. Uapishka_5]
MPTLGYPTLDQLRVFLAVAQAGSFSAAARALNRRQSVISYTVANLEEQLGGVPLFDRSRRLPVLTEAGVAVLAEARKVAAAADALRARAKGMLQGLEAEVALAVDVMLPTDHLVRVLSAFREAFPTVGLRLYTESLGSVARLVLDGTCMIGVTGPRMVEIGSLVTRPLNAVTMVPVAAPGHPLARPGGPIPREELQHHIQLVLTDRSELTKGHDFAVLSPQTWRLADLGAKHALLVGGLGWGNMPEHAVRPDIAAGRLTHLRIADLPDHSYGFSAIHRADAPPGPAGQWLLERLADFT